MTALGLTAVDYALLTLLAVSVLVGILRGLVFELMSIVGWVLAWLVASHGGELIGDVLHIAQPGGVVRSVAGFVIGFAGTLLVCGIGARLLKLLISATPLTIPDRVLGGGFGLLRGGLLLLLLVSLVGVTPLSATGWWQQSEVIPWVQEVRERLRPLLPNDLGSASVSEQARVSRLLFLKNGSFPCVASSA